MTEDEEILHAAADWKRQGKGVAIATVTATWVACPQCGEAAPIKSIVPRAESEREDRTFECRECGLPRTYSMKLN